jgi:metallo-beta-lactamase family protein
MNQESKLNIQFLSGTVTVTGSKTLVECNGKRVLIDCGLFIEREG